MPTTYAVPNHQVIGNQLNFFAWLNNMRNNSLAILTNAGIPTNGTSGTFARYAGKGCLLIDITNGNLYQNTGTKTSPVWTGVASLPGSTSFITANGSISPHTATNYVISKSGSTSITLAAPTVTVDDGVRISITSNTAFVHVVTAAGLLQTGTAFVNSIVFPAFAGASVELMAVQGKWNVVNSQSITFQ